MLREASKGGSTVHQVIALSLVAHDTECLFGLIGDANLFMVDHFVRASGGRYVPATSEASAVLMAIGYAQRTGRVGVATITHGPALTNAVTALVEGVKGSVPLVLICGDTAPDNLQHLQKIQQRELVAATGAGFVELRSPDTTASDVASAFRRAAVESRPIVLNMRADLQWAPSRSVPLAYRTPDMRAMVPSSADLDDALGIIAAAKRPIILAGRGAISDEARDAMVRLGKQIEAPLATTLKASGLFFDEPWNLGVFGSISHPATVERILESDCLIAFGASLSRYTTEAGAYLQGKRLIQIMSRASDISDNYVPDVGLVGDPGRTAKRMCELLAEAEIPPSGFASGNAPSQTSILVGNPVGLSEEVVDFDIALVRLNEAMPPERTLVTDIGRFAMTAWQAFPVQGPRKFVHTGNFAAIGLGLPEAIGAAMATQDSPTLLVAGDGGFLLGGLSELATVMREKLDLVIVICNDGSYGAEHIQFVRRSMDPALSMVNSLSFAPIARAMGMQAICVPGETDLDAACAAIANRSGPLLIELKLNPYNVTTR